MSRDVLEAIIWRTLGTMATTERVDDILDAVDEYAAGKAVLLADTKLFRDRAEQAKRRADLADAVYKTNARRERKPA